MSLRVERLQADDLVTLIEKKANTYIGPVLTEAQIESLEMSPHSYTIFIDGEVMLCGGVVEYWTGRGEAWAVLNPNCRRNFVEIHSAVKRFFDTCSVRRIEASVAVGFDPGHRWVRALGFNFDAKLRKFLPDGQDVFFYSRVRED